MAICSCVAALSLTTAMLVSGDAQAGDLSAMARHQPAMRMQLADARDYTHCHNLPRHTHCHKAQDLPRNWPPNSDTPATESHRHRHAHDAAPSGAGDERALK